MFQFFKLNYLIEGGAYCQVFIYILEIKVFTQN